MHLIDWLIERQGERTDEEFAEFLGVSRALWSLLRRGLRTPSAWFLLRVMRAWPGECEAILALDSDRPRDAA